MYNRSIIKRQNRGRRKTRFGIVLDLLFPRHQNLLLRNDLLKDLSADDNALYILFKIEDKLRDNQIVDKLYVDPHTNGISTHVCMHKNLKLVNWNCAYCRIPIESKMDYFKPENFTCEKCCNKYLKDIKWIPDIILEDSLNFTKYCKKLLKEDQKLFLNYLKKSKKQNE